MSITGDLLDNSTVVDNVTITKNNNILSVKNYGITQLQVANDAIADRSIISMAYSKLTSLPARLVDLIAVTPALNYTLGTNGTNIILRSPADQLTALGTITSAQMALTYLALAGGTMTGPIAMGTQKITGLGTPTLATDACTKAYSDAVTVTQGLNILVTGTGQSKQVAGNPQLTQITSITLRSNSATVTDITILKSSNGASYFMYLPASPPTYATATKYVLAMQSGGGCTWIDPQILTSANANITITGNVITLEPVLANITSLTMAGNLVMANNKITGLALPTDPGDATSKEYVDSFAYVSPAALTTILAGYLTLSGGTMTGILTMGNNKITGLPTPTLATDAVNLSYLESVSYGLQVSFNSTIAQYLSLMGGALSGNLSMGTHLITNVLAPTSATDAANKAYVDGIASSAASNLAATAANYMPLSGGTHSGSVNMGNNAITNLPNPTNSGDAANKAYVDLLASGFSIKPVVQCLMATTGGYTYGNGILGFGATLTKINSTSVGLNIDSYILNTGDRVLVNTTLTPAYNGVYQLTTNGVNGQNTVLTRAADSDGTPLIELHPGATFFVQNGSIYGGYQYTQTSVIPATVGTDSITYSAITAPSSVTAGSNIIVYQNEVELNPTVTGLNSLQFTSGSGYVNISKAIGGSNYNMILPPSGSAGNQYLVYDNYGVASWTTAPSSGGTYTAGSNLSLNSGVFSVNSALTAINSMQLKEANTSGLVILGKSAGSASYSLNLPAAAPTTNTYLKYDGADYTWSTAGSNTSSLIACQFIHVSSVSNLAVTTNSFHSWNQMVGYSGNAATLTSPTQFTLLPGFTYKCTAMLEVPSTEIVVNWYSVTGSVIFGSAADAGMSGRGNLAIGFITPSVNTIISLQVLYIGVAGGSNVETYNKQPWAIIEVVSSNVSVSQFTGSTASLPGVAGFIPAPAAGTQNSYLRGDGNWVSANNGPTAAQFLFATSIANQTLGTVPAVISFPDVLSRSGIIALSNSTFSLLTASTYKLSACIIFCSINMVYRWFNVTTGTYILGESANNSGGTSGTPNMAFITTTTPTTIALHATYGSGVVVYGQGYDNNYRGPWITIEMLSNNNTISAFTGATSNTDGIVGYIPAPPAGTQNSYLRGDGSWQQANNAPTAAEYIHVTSNNNISVPAINTAVPLPNLLAAAGSRILQPTSTTFQLEAYCSYKCTGVISVVAMGVIYQWYNVTTGTLIGVAGNNGNSLQTQATMATAIISPTVQTTLSLYITYISQGGTIYGQTQQDQYRRGPFALIEVISNNNTITQFTGASSGSAGSIGYIPAPSAGQQNFVLTGGGNWSTISTVLPAKSWYNDAGGTNPVALVSTSYMVFGLGVGGVGSTSAGSAISKVSGVYVYSLAAGNSYRIRYYCDIYSATSATSGSFYIVKSSSSTLPSSPSLSTDTIGSLYATNSTLASYYKVEVVGYITTTAITYIGIRYGGSAGPAQIANQVLEIDLL